MHINHIQWFNVFLKINTIKFYAKKNERYENIWPQILSAVFILNCILFAEKNTRVFQIILFLHCEALMVTLD